MKKAANLLPLLRTLVAPGFFDPNVLGSGRSNIFEVNIAKGIVPIKYSIIIILLCIYIILYIIL